MATRSLFACRQCEYQSGKWLGRCPECDAWASFEERTRPTGPARSAPRAASRVIPFPEVGAGPLDRISTGLNELDRVLGGGLVPGAVILIGGEPGIGKSTLLLQAASALADSGRTVLYVTGEESAAQLRSRGDRLGVSSPGLLVLAETDVAGILEAAIQQGPAMMVVDSIQAVRCTDLTSVPGSVGQVRESAARFVEHAKTGGMPILLVGHVTKEGSIAGPRALEHVVDTVAQFEGDRHHEHRLLRALKNRFGPTDELGVFRMTDGGLVEVADPSELLLAERTEDVPGSVVMAAMEGTRPILVEIQALVGDPTQGSPRRTALGVDPSRVALILAVLQRSAGLDLGQRDVFVNVTGGLTIGEPASDLPVACAVVSSALAKPLPPGTAVAGEIGLTGEIRAVRRLEARLREAARLGFERAVTPAAGLPEAGVPGLRTLTFRRLDRAFVDLFGS